MNISNLPEVASKSYDKAFLVSYLEILSMLERLHRLMLDIINDEFKRGQILEINSVQGLLIFNIGDDEVAAGELKSRGYYQGSNVSYNLKKLVELDYVHYQRCDTDRRSFRVRLTEKGQHVRDIMQNILKKMVFWAWGTCIKPTVF